MTFDSMVHQVKARTRSIHLDRASFNLSGSSTPKESTTGPTTSPPQPTRRTSSLPLGQENRDPSASPPQLPENIRHYRSMLDIEEPPKLSPWKPMSFDELYASPIQDVAKPEQPDQVSRSKNPLSSSKPGVARKQNHTDRSSQEPHASASVPNRLTLRFERILADSFQ